MSDPNAPQRSSAMVLPSNAAMPRRSPSIRRTSHIDMRFVDDRLELSGAARDLVTDGAGATVAGSGAVFATTGPDNRLMALTTDPDIGAAKALLGASLGRGFRDALHAAAADEMAAGTPLALLLDDLPVAALISGYARLYSGDVKVEPGGEQRPSEDICSGWRADGTMMASIRAGNGVPVTLGPTAPQVEDERVQDELAWHDMPARPLGSMRRRRLVDVSVEAPATWSVRAMFRDTHVDPDDAETVLHEYTLTATVDAATGMVSSCAAVPRVLPWVECPVAAASAGQLIGRAITAVRDTVRRELRGVSTCTHLNDLLRSLGDVSHLAATLTRA